MFQSFKRNSKSKSNSKVIKQKFRMINMNLPAINIKMKSHNNQFKQDPSSMADGFGLGIQVFKIESIKNMDNNFKSKNRTAIKNIENPLQTHSFKAPVIPKPKRLPSLQKSSSQINPKQRLSAFLSHKIQSASHSGMTDKIMERKHPNIEPNTIVTPASYSMRKKVGVSTQKNISSNQTSKPLHQKNFIIEKQKPGRAVGPKLNQTAPPQTMYKPQESFYQNYHAQHQVLLKFYSQFENCQKQHLKEIKQLKKLKENQFDTEIYDRIDDLESTQGKISSVMESLEKQEFDQKVKVFGKDDKKNRKTFNTIVPISGFEWSEIDCFQYDTIENYQMGDYSGAFKINTYENVDFAPVNIQMKDEEEDQ